MVKRNRRFRRPRAAPGTSPGTIHVDPEAPKPVLTVMAYGPEGLEERPVAGVDEIAELRGKHPVLWLNVDGLGDAGVITGIGELFGLHKLALEDVVNTHQRPKVEDYGENLFAVVRMPSLAPDLRLEQLSLFLGRDYVLTFQERVGDCLDPVRERIRKGRGRIRPGGADYLAYAILDAVVDHYFPVLERYGERLEELEEAIFEHPRPEALAAVHAVKRDLLSLRRALWPQREALGQLTRGETGLIQVPTGPFLRDCYDHAVQVLDVVETSREIASGLVDGYLSSVSNRMNEVMKVLTIIATIFIPLTFIAGIYGMNFENMPELGVRWAYPAVWGLMLLLAAGMVAWFRRRRWL